VATPIPNWANTNRHANDFKKVTKITQTDPVVYYNYATTLSKMGKFAESIEKFDQAIKLKPDYLYALQGRASTKTLNQDFEGALDDYNSALETNPTFVPRLARTRHRQKYATTIRLGCRRFYPRNRTNPNGRIGILLSWLGLLVHEHVVQSLLRLRTSRTTTRATSHRRTKNEL
jgi:tetratricopeptide (TPR) repeat protein